MVLGDVKVGDLGDEHWDSPRWKTPSSHPFLTLLIQDGIVQPVNGPSAASSRARWVPAVLAIVFYVAFSALVLSRPERMIEPDPYAYRASIAALENSDLTLDQQQYDALSLQLQQTSLGGGIAQWRMNSDGVWVSEKNPGYPFLAVGFDEVGAMRLAPLFYGALACLGLWFGARRWLGRWGGTFAVAAYCSTTVGMVMAWRSFMPTFTDASLVAAGLGLLVWTALAHDRGRAHRIAIGALAFLSLSLAVFVRYTNVTVLAVAGAFALLVCLQRRWGLGWRALPWWALAAVGPLIASLIYNAVVFSGPFSTGYNSSDVKFTLSALSGNWKVMPKNLWEAMPIFVLGVVAVLVLVITQIVLAMRARRGSGTKDVAEIAADVASDAATTPVSTAVEPRLVDRWVGAFLVLAWGAVWGTYALYQWTANFGAGGRGGGPGGFGGGPGGAMGGMAQPVYSTVRFYLPALGAIALLVAWLLTRLPTAIGIATLAVLFVIAAQGFVDVTNSQWARMSFNGGGQLQGGGGQIGPGSQQPGGLVPGGQLPGGPPTGATSGG